MTNLKLPRGERLGSHTAIEALFATDGDAAGRRAMAYPLRTVWRPRDDGGTCHRVLVMVPKKRLRKAVDRVKMRRRIREAYRLGRHLLPEGAAPHDIALVYVADSLKPYSAIEKSIMRLLPKVGE